jgi:Rad3-related DNA helicase
MVHSYSILDDVTPEDLGLPAKFSEFRQIQREAVHYGLYGPGSDKEQRRFIAEGQPAGSGKSITSLALGKMAGCKFVILTATRALEDQYVSYGVEGLVNVRGRRNYHCTDPEHLGDPTWDCDRGDDERCPYSGTGRCAYRQRVEEAKEAGAIVTNYAYWMQVRSRNQAALEVNEEDALRPDPIRLLIADEAHLADGLLSNFLGIWVGMTDLHRFANTQIRQCVQAAAGKEWGMLTKPWIEALATAYASISTRMNDIAIEYPSNEAARRLNKDYRRLAKVYDDLNRILSLGGDGNWLWRMTRSGIAFDCVWPGRYAERYLWTGVERVVLMSGTLRPMAMTLLGLSASKYWFQEWPRVFPATNNPVVWVPYYENGKQKRVTIGKKATDEDLEIAIRRADAIYDEWAPGIKGMVQSTSYKRAEYWQAKSKWGRYMLLNKPGEAGGTMERFMKSEPPCILVSPSYTTGWDVPPDLNQGWMHIPKLPFADLSDPVVQARRTSDPDWYDYMTAQTFQQETARMVRNEFHKCTVMVTDDAIGRFRQYARKHWSTWYTVLEAPGGKVPRAPRM